MKEYILNLDRPRKLKFGFKATRLINEKFKEEKNLKDLAEFALDEFIFLAWAGLSWEDESLTVEKVEELMDDKVGVEYSQTDIANIIAEAMTAHSGAEAVKKKTSETIPSRKHGKSHLKSA
jgi:heterodisulfide reductase subunit B